MTRLLLSNKVPYPESLIEKTTKDPTHDMQLLGFSEFWIKRGDFQAIQQSDVAFVKDIKGLGFYRYQKSVFLKLCLDQRIADSMIEKVKKIAPKDGSIAIITITEKQFGDIHVIIGENKTEVLNSDERNIIL